MESALGYEPSNASSNLAGQTYNHKENMKVYHITIPHMPGESWFVKAESEAAAIEEVLEHEHELPDDCVAALCGAVVIQASKHE